MKMQLRSDFQSPNLGKNHQLCCKINNLKSLETLKIGGGEGIFQLEEERDPTEDTNVLLWQALLYLIASVETLPTK